MPCFLEITSILRQKTAETTNKKIRMIHLTKIAHDCGIPKGSALWWGPGQSPGGVWGKAPKELCICHAVNAQNNLKICSNHKSFYIAYDFDFHGGNGNDNSVCGG
jgi:hypothetical protein